MAVIRNTTNDTLSLFRADAPPIDPGDEITVRDENFVDRAWPKSTWELVEPPQLDGYTDHSTDEAWLYAEPSREIEGVLVESDTAGTGPAINADTGEVTVGGKALDDMTRAELADTAAALGVDTPARATKADLIDAITAHTQED